MHITISGKKPPRSYNLSENKEDVKTIGNASEGNSQTPNNLLCVVSASRRCVAITLSLAVVVVLSIACGILYLTTQHKNEIRQMEALITTHEAMIDELEADAKRRFEAANITLYEHIDILRNETKEQFRETNETIFLTVEDLWNHTLIAFQEANMTIYTEIYLYENDTDFKLADIFIDPFAFEARNVDLSPSTGRMSYNTVFTNEGNAYSSTGYFEAPVDGIYIATFEICVNSNSNFRMYSTMHSTKKKMSFYLYSQYGCHSGFQVGLLDTGNNMSTYSYDHHYGLTNAQSTSFSGFLINKRH